MKGKFAGTDKNDVKNVKAYFATNSRELFVDEDKKMEWRDENGVQYGEDVTIAADGTFTIKGNKDNILGAYVAAMTARQFYTTLQELDELIATVKYAGMLFLVGSSFKAVQIQLQTQGIFLRHLVYIFFAHYKLPLS